MSKLSKKAVKKFWGKFFGNTFCPYCGRNINLLAKVLEEQGIYEEIYKKCPTGIEQNITGNFNLPLTFCPYCKEPLEIYFIRGQNTFIIK